ncbi:hypothetical protein K933_04626 [Candidatus Halobonum tyrrellensis G22]|uniref:Archaeal Type IV pilin N-terminal domain-containing protein n=2 Tax=Candidatus Halobonum TaxID=1431544 RepID=V4HGN3_9EURY|nr:hypothetical protein K933_04626 [Candidatus Halobonum tyrrellensis G22]
MGGPTDDEATLSLRERVRVALPHIAMASMLLTTLCVAGIAGTVATGIGGPVPPEGLVASVQSDGNDVAVVVEHPNGSLPAADRVFVVDGDGARVPWNDTRSAPGVARITGRGTALGCPRQGSTYRVVFEGRTGTETVLTHEVTQPIPASAVQRCEASE